MQKLACFRTKTFFLSVLLLMLVGGIFAQTRAKLTLELDEPGTPVSSKLYGLMTEEINFPYDGGLYGELISNRMFRDSVSKAAFWDVLQGSQNKVSVTLDKNEPLNKDIPISLRFDVEINGGKAGIANEGYWGFPIRPAVTYKGSLYVRQSGIESGTLTVALESPDGTIIYASAEITGISPNWRLHHFALTTQDNVPQTSDARFVITTTCTGSYWFDLVSLFPPTWNNRPNGNRPDLMQLLADMRPAFLRFLGGNYLEENTFAGRWDWKKTIGPLEQRPGHLSPWRYRSTDGVGLVEFQDWCEDLHMEPLLAVFAGFVLNKDYLESGPFLQPFVNDALDEIEYVTGDSTIKWGAQRAKDGHSQPFKLNYIEIVNEDGGDYSDNYWNRYIQFYDAIKTRYPQLKIISMISSNEKYESGMQTPVRKIEIVDEHYYPTAAQMEENAYQFDDYDRNGPKILVGEWVTRKGSPTPNFNAALGDAAWMTGMERNADLVIMSSYAPLLVNVNPGGMQWRCNLIGYNTLTAYGSPSYYAQKLFSNHLGNRVMKIAAENMYQLHIIK
jgi:alpha-L-arabinofuranosidase